MLKDTLTAAEKQESLEKSKEIKKECVRFLVPLLKKLEQHLDHRLINTLVDLVMIIVIHRHRNQGMVLSELGGELLGEKHAPAGTKRISNLLHSKKWKAQEIEDELWEQGNEKVEQLNGAQEEALVIWDESEQEKPESLAAEGLCPVRSSKAARLKRIKPGYFNPPGGRPIFVPGFHWLQVIVVGMRGAPCLAHLHWWTTRGEQASDKRSQESVVLKKVAEWWGSRVVHVFDQGYAGSPWTLALLDYPLARFVIRWKKGYKLVGPDGQAKLAWQILRGKRSMDHKEIWDTRRRVRRTVGIVFAPVYLPESSSSLWLVASRPGPGHKPWYLLTNLPITSVEQAWHIVFIYARRWQIEMTLRFEKAELAFESLRLQKRETRRKFLLIASLVHAFLILLLSPPFEPLKLWLLDTWCHRNGKRSRITPAPLYRLRLALSQLWRAFCPFHLPLLNSG
jgi:transposase